MSSTPPLVDKCLNINCGIHGSCSNGSCTCKDNYTGTLCDISPTTNSGGVAGSACCVLCCMMLCLCCFLAARGSIGIA